MLENGPLHKVRFAHRFGLWNQQLNGVQYPHVQTYIENIWELFAHLAYLIGRVNAAIGLEVRKISRDM